MEEGAACPGGLGEALPPHLPHTQAHLPQIAEVLVRSPTPGLRRPLQTGCALQGLEGVPYNPGCQRLSRAGGAWAGCGLWASAPPLHPGPRDPTGLGMSQLLPGCFQSPDFHVTP